MSRTTTGGRLIALTVWVSDHEQKITIAGNPGGVFVFGRNNISEIIRCIRKNIKCAGDQITEMSFFHQTCRMLSCDNPAHKSFLLTKIETKEVALAALEIAGINNLLELRIQGKFCAEKEFRKLTIKNADSLNLMSVQMDNELLSAATAVEAMYTWRLPSLMKLNITFPPGQYPTNMTEASRKLTNGILSGKANLKDIELTNLGALHRTALAKILANSSGNIRRIKLNLKSQEVSDINRALEKVEAGNEWYCPKFTQQTRNLEQIQIVFDSPKELVAEGTEDIKFLSKLPALCTSITTLEMTNYEAFCDEDTGLPLSTGLNIISEAGKAAEAFLKGETNHNGALIMAFTDSETLGSLTWERMFNELRHKGVTVTSKEWNSANIEDERFHKIRNGIKNHRQKLKIAHCEAVNRKTLIIYPVKNEVDTFAE